MGGNQFFKITARVFFALILFINTAQAGYTCQSLFSEKPEKIVDSFEEFFTLANFAFSKDDDMEFYGHRVHHELSNEVYENFIREYVEAVDPYHLLFYKRDIERFYDGTPESFAKFLRTLKKDVHTHSYIFRRYLTIAQIRYKAINDFVSNLDENEQELIIQNAVNLINGDPSTFQVPKFIENEEGMRIHVREKLSNLTANYIQRGVKPDSEALNLAVRKLKRLFIDHYFSQDERLFTTMLKAFYASLDAHSEFQTHQESRQREQLSRGYIPLGVGAFGTDEGMRVFAVTPDSIAHNSGLQEGDIIVELSGVSLEDTDNMGFRALLSSMAAENLDLKIKREGQVIQLKVDKASRQQEGAPQTPVRTQYSDDTGNLTLQFDSFYEGVGEDIKNTLLRELQNHDVKSVVLDLRYNGGGLINEASEILSLFIDDDVFWMLQDSIGETHYEHPEFDEDVFKKVYDGPLGVLINGHSASASELVSGTLKHTGRAIIMGSQHSFGKGSAQSTIPTFFGNVKITTNFFYSGRGRSPQHRGVQSDVVIKGSYFNEKSLEKNYRNSLLPEDLHKKIDGNKKHIKKVGKLDSESKERRVLVEKLQNLAQKRQKNKKIQETQEKDGVLEEALKIMQDYIKELEGK